MSSRSRIRFSPPFEDPRDEDYLLRLLFPQYYVHEARYLPNPCPREIDIEDLCVPYCSTSLTQPAQRVHTPTVPSQDELNFPKDFTWSFAKRSSPTKNHPYQVYAAAEQCPLESTRYFERRERNKWHSSTEQEKDMLEMMSIEQESATTNTHTKAMKIEYNHAPHSPELANESCNDSESGVGTYNDDWKVPELEYDYASHPSNSPDELMKPLTTTFNSTSESSLPLFPIDQNNVNLFDVNQMFDWDQAAAVLVDEHMPQYHQTNFDKSYGNAMIIKNRLDANLRSSGYMPVIPEYSDSMEDAASARDYEMSRTSDWTQANAAKINACSGNAHPPGSVVSEDDPIVTCYNCGVTKTPLWRRTPDKRHSLCNACGLYLKQYKVMRPAVPRNKPSVSRRDELDLKCFNCGSQQTSLWRKDEGGNVVCNACGLYHKLHGKVRPVGMRKEKISRRKRYRNISASPSPQNAELPEHSGVGIHLPNTGPNLGSPMESPGPIIAA